MGEGDTIVALSQNTRTSPVFSVVVLVRTPTSVPGVKCLSVPRVVDGLVDPIEDGVERGGGGGVEGVTTVGRGEV